MAYTTTKLTGDQIKAKTVALKKEWDEVNTRLARVEDESLELPPRALKRLQRRLETLKEDVIVLNRGLVFDYTKRFHSRPSNEEDFSQAGYLGLWEAFLKWDPAQSTLGNFSRNYIAGAVNRAVHRSENQGISYGDSSAQKGVKQAEQRLQRELGRQPTDKEIAAASGNTETLVARLRIGRPASLDTPVGDGDSTLGDLAASMPSNLFETDDIVVSDDDLRALAPMELFAILRRTGLDGGRPARRNELANMTGIGRETLRRIENQAATRLGIRVGA